MSAAQWVGAGLLAAPFVAFTVYMVWVEGVLVALATWALLGSLVAFSLAGTALLFGGLR